MADPLKTETTLDLENMVHTDSDHEFHKDLYRTVDLLSLETVKGKVFFVVEGLAVVNGDEPLNKHYWYDEHTCPTNYMGCAMIVYNNDSDPHGVFSFERAVWMTKDYLEDNDTWIIKTFPELGVAHV